MKRRIVSGVLALCLTVCLFPAAALAAEGDFTIENGVLVQYNGTGGEVAVPAGVTAIGPRVFAGREDVTGVTIPEGVTSIGWNAFYESDGLRSVTIPASVTSIERGAFWYCDSLERVDILGRVTAIEANTFSNCYALKRVTLPQGLTSIGEGAFMFCALTDIALPDSVTSIGKNAFTNCESLQSVVIPSGVTAISEGAFLNCKSLKSATLPDGVTSIGQNGFSGCAALAEITLPKSLTSIGRAAFSGCKSLKSVEVPAGVTTIGTSAFLGCSGLTSVSLPDSVTTIGDYAFSDCTSLTSLAIPRGATVGKDAFQGATSLKTEEGFTIVNGVLLKYLGGSTGQVTVPDGVTEIGEAAFYNCRMTGVTLPDSLTSIGDMAFTYCSKLTSLNIPGSVTHIGKSAFKGTPWYEGRQGKEFTVINDNLLDYNGPGGKVTIPEGVREVRSTAFGFNETITEVVIPDSVTMLGEQKADSAGAFSGCTALRRVEMGDGITELYWTFSGCTALTDVKLPDNLKVLGMFTFQNCSSLTRLELPASLEEIGTRTPGYFRGGAVFDGTGLTVLQLPHGLKKLDDDAFRSSNLKEIILPDTVESMGYFLFEGCPDLTSVTFPKNEKAAGQWKWQDSHTFWEENFYELSDRDSQAPPLETIVNCPNDMLSANLSANQALLERWKDPERYLEPQSERITAVSNEIAGGIAGEYEKARAVYTWVAENIAYDFDYILGNKTTVTIYPEEVLDSKLTICDGYARLTAALLQAQGIPTMYLTGTAITYSDQEAHAWNLALVDGRWIWLDPTWGRNHNIMDTSLYRIDMDYFDPLTPFFSSRHKVNDPELASGGSPSGWAQAEVTAAIAAALVPGDLQSAYQNNITREEFCRLMMALVEQATGKLAQIPAASPFTDTDSAPVLAAHALGLVNGTSDTTFTPGGSITRQEAATMLSRTAKLLGLTAGTGERFADAETFAPWAADGIALVSGLAAPGGAKVMGGTGDGNFSPAAFYSREQAILTALRLFHCAEAGR